MLRLTMLALGASLAIGAATANEAAAQSGRDRAAGGRTVERDRNGSVIVRDRDRYDCVDRYGRRVNCDYDRRNDRDYDSDSDRSDRKGKKYSKNSRGNGPAFCRSGAGHPVHGMAWCRDKGWSRDYGRYSRVGWEDVILRRPRYSDRDLSRGTLQDILGSVIFGRFDRQRSRLGYSQPLYGRWSETGDGATLRLFSGTQPIAQIYDRDRDGRGDVVLLYNGR